MKFNTILKNYSTNLNQALMQITIIEDFEYRINDFKAYNIHNELHFKEENVELQHLNNLVLE